MLEQCANDTREESPKYVEFVEKFKPKKTTDDCFTPDWMYDTVADYVAEYYKRDKSAFVRPFYPGGDYERYNYPDGCVVVDNPPFSTISQICRFYNDRHIDYFLFAPHLTCFCIPAQLVVANFCAVYDNGAKVATSFATNMDEYKIRTAPDLLKKLNAAFEIAKTKQTKKYINSAYPDNLITSNKLFKICYAGIFVGIKANQAHFVRKTSAGKGIYGGGFLISDAKAAEIKAAEMRKQEQRYKIELSDAEKEIIRQLE